MLKRLLFTLIMGLTFLNLFCQSNRGFSSVDVETFANAVADTTYTVLDVRTPAEYREGHILGCDYNIDVLDDSFKERSLSLLPKDKGVALYCRSGNRSKRAARILSESGYRVIELIEVEIEKGYTSSVPAPDYENGGEFEN